MASRAHLRGHPIQYVSTLKYDGWVYSDNCEPTVLKDKYSSIENVRQCKKCGCLPTKDGHDACLGKLKNVKHACCGHGVEKGYVIYNESIIS